MLVGYNLVFKFNSDKISQPNSKHFLYTVGLVIFGFVLLPIFFENPGNQTCKVIVGVNFLHDLHSNES